MLNFGGVVEGGYQDHQCVRLVSFIQKPPALFDVSGARRIV